MAWKQWAMGVAFTAAGGANLMYISTTAEDAADEKIKEKLEPISDKIDMVYDSQIRIESYFREHLYQHD